MESSIDATDAKRSKRIVIVLPTMFAVRYILETQVLTQLAAQPELEVTILTPFAEDEERIAALKRDRFKWNNIHRPRFEGSPVPKSFSEKFKKFLYVAGLWWFRRRMGFGMLAYRFNHIHQFAAHCRKIHMNRARRIREARAGNYLDWWLGFPFPLSRKIYDKLYHLYYSPWDYDTKIEGLFDTFKPDLLVFSYLQDPSARNYLRAAQSRNIPITAIIGSWDRLTTKGPLAPGVDQYVVQSQVMRDELIRHHNIAEQQIYVAGWPQMDEYKDESILLPREQFLNSIGVPLDHKLIVFGANSPRLGVHEISIVEHLARRIKEKSFPPKCTLLVRPHPKDKTWQERFGVFQTPPEIIVQPAETGRLEYLANLLHHTDVMIASQGSITLDAIAQDTCVVNIAFDGNVKVDYHESIERWYEIDHFLPVVNSGATSIVKSFEEMDAAISHYLDDPSLHAAERERLRQEELEPFDGKASLRLATLIADAAHGEEKGS